MKAFSKHLLTIFLITQIFISSLFSQKCIDLGCGASPGNGEYSFIDFAREGGRWEIEDSDGHPWYKINSLEDFRIINGAYYTYDIDWSGSINNDAWGPDWADTYHSYYQMSIEQEAFDAQGWPKEVPYTLHKYHTYAEDPNLSIDMTQPVTINEVSRRYYFPANMIQDGWILKWDGTGAFDWQGLEITNVYQGTAVEGGNSWSPDGSYAGKDVQFTSTGGGRIECKHFYMIHGFVLTITDSDPADPIRNISFIYPGLEANHDAGEIYHPLYIERMKQFKVLRYMGFLDVNDIEKRRVMAESHPFHDSHMLKYMEWNERTPDDWYKIDDGCGAGYKYVVELANLTKTDTWINLPYCSGTAYADSFVNYFLERLDPDLTIYIEVGNELWNYAPSFMGHFWQARNRVLRYPGLGDVEAKGAYTNEILESVTQTAGSRGLDRIERVVGAFPRYTDYNNRTLNYIDEDNWDCLATTWYFGLEQNNPAEMDCIDDVSGENWRKVLYDWHLANPGDQAGFNVQYRNCVLNEFRCSGGYSNNSDVVLANYYGKELVCYEGGNHTFYGCTNAPYSRIALEDYDGSDPELEFDNPTYPEYITNNSFVNAISVADESEVFSQVYSEIIDSMQSAGIKVANHLAFSGRSSCYGVWYFIQSSDLGMSLDSLLIKYPKFKVFSDRIIEDNCNAIYIDIDSNNIGPGLSVMMDGLNDYVEGPSTGIPNESSDYTMETWFKIRHLDIQQTVMEFVNDGANDNYNILKVRLDKKIVWEIGNNSTVYAKLVGTALEEERWYHIALTKSGNRYTMYLNGINVVSGNYTIPVSARNHFCIGASYSPPFGTSNLGGEIDEVRIWNTALTVNNIRDYMCKKVTALHPNYANLVTYYRFDRPDKVNFEVYDIKAGVNTGNLYNINFTERSRFAVSSAPLGDYSKFIYTYDWTDVGLTLNHPQGDMVAVSNIGAGGAYGVHAYIVDDGAYFNDLPEFYEAITDNRYMGVFVAGGNDVSYDINYIYQGNPQSLSGTEENKHRLLKREHAADEFWIHSGAKLDLITSSLSVSCKEKDRAEYTLAFRQTDNILRPGSGMALHQNFDHTDDHDGGKIQYLGLNDYTVTFWSKGYGSVFNFTGKFAAGEEWFSVLNNSGNVYAGMRYSPPGGPNIQTFPYGTSPTVGTVNDWIHWAVVRNSTRITVYVNGREVVSQDFIGQRYREELHILNAPDWAGVSNITIDEFTVWDIPLPVDDIRNWMCKKVNEEHSYECENLVLYFNFDEGQGSVLEDRRGRSDMALNPLNTFVTSGAAVGDESDYDYVSPDNFSFAHPNGDYIEVSKATSDPSHAVHLYRTNEPPIPSASSGSAINSIDSSRYWGLFVVDDYDVTAEYNVVMHYDGNNMIVPGNEDELRLMSRTNAEDAEWTANDAVLPDLGTSTITLNNMHNSEYILGGTTTNTFIGDCTPAQPVFVAESGLVNMTAVCGNATGLIFVIENDPLVDSYIWTLPNGLSGFSTSDTIVVNAELGYESPPDFTILVVGANRCGESVAATYDVTINPPPTIADAGPDQLILPPLTTATMDGNAFIGGETGVWTIGSQGTGIITLTNDPVTTITGLASGTNYFVWTIDNGLCQPSIDTVAIVVAPPPQNITMANGDPLPQRICEGEIITLKAIPAEDIVPDGYQWTLPDGLSEVSSISDEITILVGSGIGGTIEVSSVYSGSPSDPYISVIMGINPQPNKPVFVNDYSIICLEVGTNIQAAYDATIDSFVWTFPTYLVPTVYPKSTLETIEVQALDTITGYIKVKAFNNGCTNADAADSVYFEVTTAPEKPILGLGTDGGAHEQVCSGFEEALFWVKNNDPDAFYEWRWPTEVSQLEYFGDNQSASLFQVTGYGHIYVKAVKGTGACSESEEFDIQTWPNFAPGEVTTITIIDPPATDPMDLLVGQTYTVEVTGTATNYYWNIPDGIEILDNANNKYDDNNQIIVNEDFAGYLEIYPITYHGCANTEGRIAIGTAGSIMPPEFVSGVLKICQGTALNITVTDVGATEYVWTLPDGSSPIVTTTPVFNQVINTAQAGAMTVFARTGGNESTAIEFYIEVDGATLSKGNFVDIDGNPLATLNICTDFNGEGVYYEDIFASEMIWSLEGGAIMFEPRWQEGHEYDDDWDLENRTTAIDTMFPVTYYDWRETNSGSDGYIFIDFVNSCGGSDIRDSIYYSVVTPVALQVPNFTEMPTSVCVGSNVTYRLDPIENAEQYIWGLPSGFEAPSVVTTVPEITVDIVNGLGGQITVYAMGSICGGGQTMTQVSDEITIAGEPSDFDFIEAPLAGCPGDNLTYIVNDAGVTDYTWSIPFGLLPDLDGSLITIDNDDAECMPVGTWNIETNADYMNGSFLRQGELNSYDTYVLYTPDIQVAGKYRVTITYAPAASQGWGFDFDVDVIDRNGTTNTDLVYSKGGDPYIDPLVADLGIYDFEIGTSGYLRANTMGSVEYRPIGVDNVVFELVEEFILADTSVTFEVTNGGISSLCVTIADPQCASGYTVCTEPINLGGNMNVPIFEAQEAALCIGSSYEFQVSNIGADTYTWMLPVGLSIGGNTGEVSGLSRTETIDVDSDPGTTIDIGVFGVINSCSVISDTVYSVLMTVTNCDLTDPEFIVEEDTICSETATLYSILPILEAEEYEWQLPAGIEESVTGSTGTIITTVPNITVVATGTGEIGYISVRANAPVAGITSSDWVSTANPIYSITQPVFTVSVSDVSSCAIDDGEIIISGLTALSSYQLSYNNGIIQGPTAYTTDGTGEILITGLAAGSYSDISVSMGACATVDNGPYTIENAGVVSISSATFVSSVLCGQTGSVVITLSGATEGDEYAIDLNDDALVEDTVMVVGGELEMLISTEMTVSGIAIENIITFCTDVTSAIGTISMPDTAQIDTVIFNQPLSCGGTGSIAIEVSNASEGQAFDIDLNNDMFVDHVGTVSGGVIGISGITAGVIVSDLVITSQTSLCPSSSSITGSLYDPTTVSVSSLVFTHPATCDGTGEIVINLSGAINGDTYDIDYNGDNVIDHTGTVASDAITIIGLYAGVGINALVITNTNDNCSSTSLETDTLENPPLPDVSQLPFNDMCENELIITLSGGMPALGTYSGNGVTAGDFNPSVAGVGIHSITYEYTDTNNCSNTAEETITVNALPAGTLTSDDADNRICVGTPIVFTATEGDEFGFMHNGLTVQSGTENIYSPSVINDQDTVGVFVTYNGCSTEYPLIVITIDPLPSGGTLTSDNEDNTICDGEQITFIATGGVNYNFRINRSIVYSASETYVSVINELAMNDTVSVEIMDANNCRSIVDSQIIVTVNPVPLIGDMYGDDMVCPGENNVEYSIENYVDYYNYEWVIEGAENVLRDNHIVLVDWNNEESTGRVKIEVTNSDTECSSKDSIAVSISDLELPSIKCPAGNNFDAELDEIGWHYAFKETDMDLIPDDDKIADNCKEAGYTLKFYVNDDYEEFADTSFVDHRLEEDLNIITWIVRDNSGLEGECKQIVTMTTRERPPGAFSPNGDGVNDAWEIGYLELYKNCEVRIFDRSGKLLNDPEPGYPIPWNGTCNGRMLPVDSYHYIIDYNNGAKPIKGTVTIIK